MKKRLSGLALAAAFICAASFTSFAGWEYNNNGSYIYKDNNGKMAVNSWIKITDNSVVSWYYALGNGAIRTDGWQKIDGHYYYFNEDGVMQTGWVDDYKYYCNENGVMATGWKQIMVPEELEKDEFYRAGDQRWFFFHEKNGDKFKSDDSDRIKTFRIAGREYGFDENGVMRTGWAKVKDESPALSGYRYFSERSDKHFAYGQEVTGSWYACYGPTGNNFPDSDLSSGDLEWFYFAGNGAPSVAKRDEYLVERINGKRFIFDGYGNPVCGFRKASKKGNNEDYYYCGDSISNCSIKTGKMRIRDDEGETCDYYFVSSGEGFTGVKDNYLYYCGRRQKAESGERYSIASLDGKEYVIDESGRVQKNKKNIKDRNGAKMSTTGAGTVKSEIDGSFGHIELLAPSIYED